MAESRSHFYTSHDGLRLHVRIHGDASSSRTPVVCLPGLTRNARDFEGLAAHLAAPGPADRQVFAFDYRGRGLSDRDPDWRNYNLAVEMQDVLAGLASLDISRAAFIGTSRGGLIIHLIAAAHPQLLAAAVLNDVGPELGGDGMAQIKAYLTMEPTRREALENWEAAAAAQKAIHAAAFPALSDADWLGVAHALYRMEEHGLVLDFDPALLETLVALDLTKPLPTLWESFERLSATPLLTIRGENSRLLTAVTLHSMGERHPAMHSLTVAGQGHAPLLGSGRVPQSIADFLSSTVP